MGIYKALCVRLLPTRGLTLSTVLLLALCIAHHSTLSAVGGGMLTSNYMSSKAERLRAVELCKTIKKTGGGKTSQIWAESFSLSYGGFLHGSMMSYITHVSWKHFFGIYRVQRPLKMLQRVLHTI